MDSSVFLDARKRMLFCAEWPGKQRIAQPAICRKEDVAVFNEYKKWCVGRGTKECRKGRWFKSTLNPDLIRVTLVGDSGGLIACFDCGEINTCYQDSYGPASYRLIHYMHPTLSMEYDEHTPRSGLELEHWRLRNDKLLADIARYWKLDDRLLEQLFDKLLLVLPFEIVYMIMFVV